MSRGKTLLLTAGTLTAGTLAYTLIARPWLLRWGATDQEARQTLPGGELVPHPKYMSTRAITIHASASQVWPWLVQMGQGRGGFYSHDWLENLIGLDIHSADTIIPELQGLKVGDKIRLAPSGPFQMDVAILEPERSLILCAPGSLEDAFERGLPYATWAFVLEPTNERTARLIVRFRSDFKPTLLGMVFNKYGLEVPHFVMERRTMLGIKRRVESSIPHR